MRIKHKISQRMSALIFVVAIGAVAMVAPTGPGGPAQAIHGGMDAMSLDMNTAGNNAASVGTIEQCARINKNNVIDADEATNVDISNPPDGIPDPDILVIDVTAENVPPHDDNGTPGAPADDSGGIVAYQYTLNYPSLFTVTSQEADDSAINVLFTHNSSEASNDIFNASEALPDDEGSNYNKWDSSVLDDSDQALTVPESGDGVLDRLTITADAGVAAGHYLLQLTDNGHVDATNGAYTPHSTGLANIAVNQACSTLTTSLGYYHPVAPKRILDTRGAPYGPIGKDQNGGNIPAAPIGAGGVLTIDVTNTYSSGVPASGVTAVVINATVTGPTQVSHLTVYPSDAPPPNAANLNFIGGQTVPNLVTVKVAPDGTVKLRNNSGSTNVIFDIQGWYGGPTSGSRFNPITPKRILDTRSAPYGPIGLDQNGAAIPAAPIGSGGVLTVDVTNTYSSGVPDTVVTAVIINVTVTGPTATSHLTVYPSENVVAPNAANLNFVAGQTVPNLVTVKVGPAGGGSVKVRNNSGSTNVIFDIVGWYGASSGDVFTPLTPDRILDTRPAPFGPIGVPSAGKMGSGDGAILTVDVSNTEGSGVPDVPAVTAVIVNTTVTEPTAPSHLTVYPSDVAVAPNAANLNFIAGQTVPNLVAVKVGPANGGSVKIRNNSGFTHVIFDVAGYFGPVPVP